jgi:hypothetical protein
MRLPLKVYGEMNLAILIDNRYTFAARYRYATSLETGRNDEKLIDMPSAWNAKDVRGNFQNDYRSKRQC